MQNLECDRAERVPDVRPVVHSDPADVELYLAVSRAEVFFGSRERAVKTHAAVGRA